MPEGMTKTGKRLLGDEMSPPSIYVDAVNAGWEMSKLPGIEHEALYGDPKTGLATLLFRLAPSGRCTGGARTERGTDPRRVLGSEPPRRGPEFVNRGKPPAERLHSGLSPSAASAVRSSCFACACSVPTRSPSESRLPR
jgi:hypothetical protein